jgi:hypothetical protein
MLPRLQPCRLAPSAGPEHTPGSLPVGNLALGVAEGAVTGAKAAKYTEVAVNLTRTCWQMYERMPSGARAPPAPARALSACAPAGPDA